MNPVYGNYVGIVINSNPDPEGRGRVQIFVPHLSTTLYQNWNNEAKDISITQGSLDGIQPNILQRLQQNLPWAECAFPLFGTGGTTYADPSTGLTRTSQKSSAPVVDTTGTNTLSRDDRTAPVVEQNVSSDSGSSGQLSLNNKFPIASATVKANAANNPGNLHVYNMQNANSNYPGQIGITGDINKGQFRGNIATFATMSDGIAANLNQLNRYINGSASAAKAAGGPLDTIAKIENAWVGGDNPTAAAEVSKFSGIGLNEKIDPNNANQMMNLMAGMMREEAGGIPVNFVEDFKKGYEIFQQRRGLTTDLSINQNQTYTGKILDSTRQLPTTDMRTPNGINSAPLPGTFVWCFFLGGDVQKPVYFAGVSEKNSHARTSSIPSALNVGSSAGTLTGGSLNSANGTLVSGGALSTSKANVSSDANFADRLATQALEAAESGSLLGNGKDRNGGRCFAGVKTALTDIGIFDSYPSSATEELGMAKNAGVLYESVGLSNVSTNLSDIQKGDILVYGVPGDSSAPGHTEIVSQNANGKTVYVSDKIYQNAASVNSSKYVLTGIYRKT